MIDPQNMTPADLRVIRQDLDRPTTVHEGNEQLMALLGFANNQAFDITKLEATVSFLLTLIADQDKRIETLETQLQAYQNH